MTSSGISEPDHLPSPDARASHRRPIVLIGLSGTGKSTVGRLLADRLGLPFIDTDDEIEHRCGRPIAEIFRTIGEAGFRSLECEAVAAAVAGGAAVVATGGGAPMDERNRRVMRGHGTVIWLDAPTEVIVDRIVGSGAEARPLLAGDAAEALERMRAIRAGIYEQLGVRIDASGTPGDVVERILAVLTESHRWPAPERPPTSAPIDVAPGADGTLRREFHPARASASATRAPVAQGGAVRSSDPPGDAPDNPLWVRTGSRSYPVYIGSGVCRHLGTLLQRHGLDGHLRIIADERVARLYGDRLRTALDGMPQTWYLVPAGEEHKTLAQAEQLYDALLPDRPERRDLIVAIGGGVIGDLAGFVAATVLRGLRLVQVPTTLLSQVDSSVGGKVGVDHPRGKNLIGAFHQPSLVVADIDLLGSLPWREVAAGWAEVVKIAVVQDSGLFAELEAHLAEIRDLVPGPTVAAIRRAVALKARLVEQDEFDLTGVRAILNYGHTIGHALEAATGYAELLHGEAVAVGMRGAAFLAVRLGHHPQDAADRQERLLRRLGLPQAWPMVSAGAVQAAMGLDKKRAGGQIAWVLPSGLGAAHVTREVPGDLVAAAIELVTGGS